MVNAKLSSERSNALTPVSKASILVLLGIALLAGVWRATALGREGMNVDEIRQAEVARGGKSYEPPAPLLNLRSWLIVTRGAADQQQPPLAYFLQRLPNQFSSSDSAQRVLACISGTIAVFLTGLLGALLGGARVGTASALLISVSPLHIAMSRYARPYTIAQVLWLITILVAYRAYRKNTWSGWIVLSITALVFLMTRGDLPLFALAAIGGLFLLARCWKGAAALLAAGVAYLPVLAMILQSGTQYFGKPAPNWLPLLSAAAAVADPLPLVLLPLALAGVWAVRSQPLARVFIGLAGVTVMFHLAFWFARLNWPLLPRYLAYCSTPFAILGAFGFCFALTPLSRFQYAQSLISTIVFAVLAAVTLWNGHVPIKAGWREAALSAKQCGINHIWLFKTGNYLEVTNSGVAVPMYVPEFSGNWYVPIASSNPFDSKVNPPHGKVAILVAQDSPRDNGKPLLDRLKSRIFNIAPRYESVTDPLGDVDAFEHFRLFHLDLYVPRRTCGLGCTLENALTILSHQPGYTDLRREALRLTRDTRFR